MKILVIGSGGREHALAWKLSRSPRSPQILCAPGNPGISRVAECVPIRADDLEGLVGLAKDRGIDLTVVGPEIPLALGIVDRFESDGLRIFGPGKDAARIESSKAFAKRFMTDHGIPTARAETFSDARSAAAYARKQAVPLVIKADGLAAGKGVVVAETLADAEQAIEQMMTRRVFGSAGERVVVEEFLSGEEATMLAFCDGTDVALMPASQDHKRIEDGDRGANTGGMGAYAPAPVVSPAIRERVLREIILPTLRGLCREGCRYRGTLYVGLMIGEGGPKVLEFNCRFGDPEAQVVLPLLDSDLVDVLLAVVDGRLGRQPIHWKAMSALCVVLASNGYPGPYRKGDTIKGLEEVDRIPDVFLFHAGTALREGKVVTSGGRVLGMTALGCDLAEARERAYEAIGRIYFDQMKYRRDIGAKALKR